MKTAYLLEIGDYHKKNISKFDNNDKFLMQTLAVYIIAVWIERHMYILVSHVFRSVSDACISTIGNVWIR